MSCAIETQGTADGLDSIDLTFGGHLADLKNNTQEILTERATAARAAIEQHAAQWLDTFPLAGVLCIAIGPRKSPRPTEDLVAEFLRSVGLVKDLARVSIYTSKRQIREPLNNVYRLHIRPRRTHRPKDEFDEPETD